MTLHTEWLRFRKTCLAGKSPAEIAAVKEVFYCGAAASIDAVMKVTDPRSLGVSSLRRVNAMVKELERYRSLVAAKVLAKKASK